MACRLASGARSLLIDHHNFAMALLRYKLPKQAAAAIPLDATCSIQAAKQFIETEHKITSAFKLRVCVGGGMHYLKPSQTLAEVAALGTDVIIGVNFYDDVAKKLVRRQLAKETAALVRTDVQEDGAKTREKVYSSMEAVKECIREEVQKLSGAANKPAGVKRANNKLAGKKVVAAQPDHEMGDETYEICHVEQQTFPDGKHTVCLIKKEGKPTLTRQLSKLTISDPFIASGVDQCRVVVISRPHENVLYHMGWRGTVAKASSPHAKVNFPYLRAGKIAHTTVSVPREHLQILAEDDVTMSPNQHPWLGRSVTVEDGPGTIVNVGGNGRVKIALDGPKSKRKKVVFVESRGASFEALFNSSVSATEAEPQATPQVRAAEIDPHVDARSAIPVADSDAESSHGPVPPQHGADEEPAAPEPKRKRGGEKMKKAVKRPASAQPPQPSQRRRRKAVSASQDVD